MDLGSRDTLLTVGTAATLLVGVLLVVFADYLLTVVGVILVILSAIVLMIDVKALLLEPSKYPGE